MSHPTGEADDGSLRVDFDRRLKLEFHGTRITSDAGILAYANPAIYEFLEAEGYKYTIRLPANAVLQDRIGWLLKRPVGRPPHAVRCCYTSFSYRAASWSKARRVVTKVECTPASCIRASGSL